MNNEVVRQAIKHCKDEEFLGWIIEQATEQAIKQQYPELAHLYEVQL